MSLQTLSTELDINIINCLGVLDLNCMSLTSKYYREVSEPLLYKRIAMGSNGHRRIKQLLITLVSRKELRRFVQHFQLYHADDHELDLPDNYPSVRFLEDNDGDALHDRLWEHVAEIREAMGTIAQRSLVLSQFKIMWFASIFESYSLFDGALSLILCLAHNLESINLEMCTGHPLSMTRCVLQDINWHCAEVMTPEIPFQKLTNLNLKCIRNSSFHYEVPVLPQLKHLRVECSTDLSSLSKWPRYVETSNLRTIHFVNVDLDPGVIVHAIEQTRFRQVVTLCVVGVGRGGPVYRPARWETFDYPALQRAMAKNLPRLQVFAWTHMLCHSEAMYVPFGPFTDFPHLMQLDLDIGLLMSARLEDMSPFPEELGHGVLPKLKTLYLRDIQWTHLEAVHKRYLELQETEPEVLTQLVQTLAALEVPCVVLEVDMESWTDSWQWQCYPINEPAVDLLRQVADGLHALGVELRVVYYLDDPDSGRRLLVENGFTAKHVCYDDYPYAEYRMERKGKKVV